jgi:hypothetical protein
VPPNSRPGPEPLDQEALGGAGRMDLGSRYAFLYLMITNIILIMFLGFLVLLPAIS